MKEPALKMDPTRVLCEISVGLSESVGETATDGVVVLVR